MNEKIAVILFNLGGPDTISAVKPFLFNLFKDKNIIPLPSIFRYPLAFLISRLRYKKSAEIYKKLGGQSPLYPQTYAQGEALTEELQKNTDKNYKVFIAMRYWHPFTSKSVEDVQKFNPDKIILLPLYPQFSTTTTGSSLEEWDVWTKKLNLKKPTVTLCCYPDNHNFVKAHGDLILERLTPHASSSKDMILLFSAHGIPQECVDKGDPYQEHITQSVHHIVDYLKSKNIDYDFQITYQSKVGPKKWLLPNTEDVIKDLSLQNKSLCVVPIAFVSEHSETLVELDMDYQVLALEKGAKHYIRVPTLSSDKTFIMALSTMIIQASVDNPVESKKICSQKFTQCAKKKSSHPCILRF